MEKFFKLKERGTNVRTEIVAGVTTFMAMAMMPFTYNISYGIAFGIISYAVIAVFTGRAKELKVST